MQISAKKCKWLVFYSWCSGKKVYAKNSYVLEHSCLVGTSKNRRVLGNIVVERFFDVISGMPFIRPRHLKTMVRKELCAFISSKVYRNTKALVLKKTKRTSWC